MHETITVNEPLVNQRKAGAAQGWTLVLINQLPIMAIVCLMPVLPTLKEHFPDVPNGDVLIPMILTAPGLCIALLAPFAGFIVDKFGRRKLLITFVFFYGLGGIVPFFIDGFNLVFAGRLLLGAGEAFVLVIINSLLGDYFDRPNRSKWLAIQGFVGPAIATGLLALSGHLASIGWNYPFLVYGFALILSVFAWAFLFEPGKKVADTELIAENNGGFPAKRITVIALTTLLIATIYFIYTIHFSLVLDEMGIKDKVKLGNASAIASLGVPFGAIVYKIISKRPSWQQIVMVFLLLAIGLTIIGSAKTLNTTIAGAWIQQMGAGMTIPVLISWALSVIPAAYRARGMGFWTSGFFLGQFVNPVFVKGIKNIAGSLRGVYVATGVLCFCIMAALIIYNLAAGNKNFVRGK